jgi:uncharacterized membrane protein
MQYLPTTFPFWLFLFLLFLFLFILIEVGVLEYAYHMMGINQRYVLALLLLSLLGSYINIPVYQLPPEKIHGAGTIFFFGIPYIVPMVSKWPGTVIAVNLGGAVIPTLLAVYLVVKNRLYVRAFLGVAVATVIIHLVAYPVRGVGIAVPILIPPAVATVIALLLSRPYTPALAFIVGTLGTLIGADILNLEKLRGLGAPVASIGGAGTFDGIFTAGILAVLLATLLSKKPPVPKEEPSG